VEGKCSPILIDVPTIASAAETLFLCTELCYNHLLASQSLQVLYLISHSRLSLCSPIHLLPPAGAMGMGMGSARSRSHRNSPEGLQVPTFHCHSDSTDPDNEELGARAREEPLVVLVGDACMTALTTLDLRTLSPEWDRGVAQAMDSGSGCGSDLEEHLGVTFSGGEDSLVRKPCHALSFCEGSS
jgi:hypothetical protein